jgi:hypothetical protein
MGGKGSTSAVSGAMEGEASVAEGICRFPACSGSICWCNCESVYLAPQCLKSLLKIFHQIHRVFKADIEPHNGLIGIP